MEIREVFDKYYDDIRKLVFKIHDYPLCTSCGGSFLNSTCKYCGKLDTNLENIIAELNSCLKALRISLIDFNKDDLPSNKLFNTLMILRDKNILEVDSLLTEYNYKENYYDLYRSSLCHQKEGKSFSDLELNAIECMIYSNDQNVDLLNYYNLFIRNCMLRKQNVSYDCFKVLIKRFVEVMMKQFYPNPECSITNEMDLEVEGSAFFTKMRLNEYDVSRFYYGYDYNLLFIIGHEIQHTRQYKAIFSERKISNLVLDYIKEFVIFDFNKDYYRQNHNNISFEKDAEINGIVDILGYIDNLGLALLKQDIANKLAKKEMLERNLYDRNRVLNGEATTIDIEFEKVIVNHPEALYKYKQLNILYKVVDNQVVAKMPEELAADLEGYISDPNLSEERKLEYSEFYKAYLEGSRK